MASYRDRLSRNGLKERAARLRELLKECTVCPRECGAPRTEGKYGVCRTTDTVFISSAGLHYGEEPPLVGRRGSGTVFFSSCNLKCLFCQNFQISHLRAGRPCSGDELAAIMLSLQRSGCHNINLVTPTHVIPRIVDALVLASDRGLTVPIVYNCGGYERVETLKLLEDIVDVYMPDIKYSDNQEARRLSGARDYWDVVRPAVREMQRQVGCLEVDRDGVANRGVLIRHLVLPNLVAGSREVFRFIANEVSPDSYINIMDQYRPSYRAYLSPELNRPLTQTEFRQAVEYALSVGLHRGFGYGPR